MDTKQCTKCKQTKALSEFNRRSDYQHRYRSECKKCQWKMQDARKRKKRFYIRQRRAYGQTAYAVKNGTLIPPTNCDLCDKHGELEKHHPDYWQPLLIVWCHAECHREIHRSQKIA